MTLTMEWRMLSLHGIIVMDKARILNVKVNVLSLLPLAMVPLTQSTTSSSINLDTTGTQRRVTLTTSLMKSLKIILMMSLMILMSLKETQVILKMKSQSISRNLQVTLTNTVTGNSM